MIGAYPIGSATVGGFDPSFGVPLEQPVPPLVTMTEQLQYLQFAGLGGNALGSNMIGGWDIRQREPLTHDFQMTINDSEIGLFSEPVQLASVSGINISGKVILYPALAGDVIIY